MVGTQTQTTVVQHTYDCVSVNSGNPCFLETRCLYTCTPREGGNTGGRVGGRDGSGGGERAETWASLPPAAESAFEASFFESASDAPQSAGEKRSSNCDVS